MTTRGLRFALEKPISGGMCAGPFASRSRARTNEGPQRASSSCRRGAITGARWGCAGLDTGSMVVAMRHPTNIEVEFAPSLVRLGLKTPRAAAIAGIVFSIFLICSFWLLWHSVPVDPLEAGSWLETHSRRVSLALNFVPFAGIAFFWFLGVLRDRLWAEGRPVFCNCFPGQRSHVSRDAIRRRFGHGGTDACPFSRIRRPSRIRHLRLCPRIHIQRHADLRTQNGRGLYDYDLDAGSKHQPHRTLDRISGICVGCIASCW